jgi:hypothetical protein
LHVVEAVHLGEFQVVDLKDQSKSTKSKTMNYVTTLVTMCSLTLVILPKRPINNSQSKCGVDLPMSQDLTTSKRCSNTQERNLNLNLVGANV